MILQAKQRAHKRGHIQGVLARHDVSKTGTPISAKATCLCLKGP